MHCSCTVTGTVTTINSTTVDVADLNITLGSGATTAAAIDGGGITLGTGTTDGVDSVHFQYDDTWQSWFSDINMNLDSGKKYYVGGPANNDGQSGLTLAETGLAFGKGTASVKLGTALTLDKDQLMFASNDAQIKIGTAATIDKNGFSASSGETTLQCAMLWLAKAKPHALLLIWILCMFVTFSFSVFFFYRYVLGLLWRVSYASDYVCILQHVHYTRDTHTYFLLTLVYDAYNIRLKQWRISMEDIAGVKYLSMAFAADGTVASPLYETKFSVSP